MASLGFKSMVVVCVLLTTVNCQAPIMPGGALKADSEFTLYCDPSRFLNPERFIGNVKTLHIYRKAANDLDYILIARYIRQVTEQFRHNYMDTQGGRRWRFAFGVDSNGTDGVETTQLLWNVRDTMCEDAGLYVCQIDYWDPNEGLHQAMIRQKVKAAKGCFNAIVTPKPMEVRRSLYITCDASRFYIPENDVFSVSTLTVYRDFGKNKDYPLAAQYKSEIPPNAPTGIPARTLSIKKVVPLGRDYRFTFSGAEPAFAPNKNMRIEWAIHKAKYLDSGAFTCDMEYFTNNYELKKISRSELVYNDPGDLSYVLPNTTVTPVKQENLQPVLSVDRSTVPGRFNVTCDARRVRFPEEHKNVKGIMETIITVAFDEMQPYGVGLQEVWMDVWDIINTGRNWEILTGDYRDNYDNIHTASTKVIVRDSKCEDAGMYKCSIVYRVPQSTGRFQKVTEKQRLEQSCYKAT